MTELQIDHAGIISGSQSVETVPASSRRDWQRVSLFVGGIMFAVGNMLHPLEPRRRSARFRRRRTRRGAGP